MKITVVAIAAVVAFAAQAQADGYNYMWYQWGNEQSRGCVQRGDYNKYTESWGCRVGKCDYQQAIEIRHQDNYLITQDNLCLVALNNQAGCKIVLQQCRKSPGCYWKKHNEYQYVNEHGYCLHYHQNGYLVQQACGKPTYTPQVWECKPKPTPVPTVSVTVVPKPTPAPVPACTCQQWNGQCYSGYQLIARPSSVRCTGKQCANVCCVPKPVPTCTCQQWNGQCYRGYQLIDRPWSVKCAGNQCADVCCVPKPVQYTCGDYFREYGRCDNENWCKPHNERCNWDGYFWSSKCRPCDEVCCSIRPPRPQPPVVPGPPEYILAPPVCGDWFVADPSNVCGVLANAPNDAPCDPKTGCDAYQCCLQAGEGVMPINA